MIDKIKDAINLVSDLDVKQKLIDAQQLMLEMLEENRKLKEEIVDLKKKLDTKETLVEHASGCFVKENNNGIFYCPVCLGSKNNVVPMSERSATSARRMGYTHLCRQCGHAASIS